jgi:CRISPR-associated protein Csm3
MAYKFLANIIITGEINCDTALHIGGTTEGYEIGGMDNPIIRNPIDGYPYIPGSSLKGKMRSLLEWSKGLIQLKTEEKEGKKNQVGEVHICNNSECQVCRIFGTPAEVERKVGPTRLLVRDAHPTKETKEILDKLQSEKGLPKAEWKSENVINRITAEATPRTIERVPKDSKFEFEMVYGIYQVENENKNIDIEYLQYVLEAMRLLQDSALGGYGSRGSGKISFNLHNKIKIRTVADYEKGSEGKELEIETLAKVDFAKLQDELKKVMPKNE